MSDFDIALHHAEWAGRLAGASDGLLRLVEPTAAPGQPTVAYAHYTLELFRAELERTAGADPRDPEDLGTIAAEFDDQQWGEVAV